MYWLLKLTEFKKESKKTYKDISDGCGIALTTVEKLFSGRTKDPKLTMVSQIVRFLGHNLNELTGDYDAPSSTELEIIKSIRSLDSVGIQRVKDTINSERSRIEAQTSAKKTLYPCIYYEFPVSAGTGEFLDERTATIVNLQSEPPRSADYILRIAGDSMSPDFYDGDYVFVSRRTTLEFGEIGIFVADGSVYMKKYAPEGLVSLNPKYPPLRFYDGVRCLGKVIGKAELPASDE